MTLDTDNATDSDIGQWVTIPEAADRLGVTVRTIRRQVSQGKLPHKLESGRAWVKIPVTGDSDVTGDSVIVDSGPGDPGIDKRDIRLAEFAKEVEGLKRERRELLRELKDWKAQAAALTQTLAISQQRVIEARTGEDPERTHADASKTPARPWWKFWKG